MALAFSEERQFRVNVGAKVVPRRRLWSLPSGRFFRRGPLISGWLKFVHIRAIGGLRQGTVSPQRDANNNWWGDQPIFTAGKEAIESYLQGEEYEK